MFEAAVRSSPVELHFGKVSHVLSLLDQSQRQSTVSNFAKLMAKRLDAQVSEVVVADRLPALVDGIKECGLIVSPVPLGATAEPTTAKSLGTGADELLQDSPIPMLFIRDPMSGEAIENAMDTVLVAISRKDAGALEAVSWAFRIAQSQMVLLEWADGQSLEEAKRLLGGRQEERSVEQAVVGRAVASQLGPIVAAAQRHAKDHGIALHVEFRLGAPMAEILDIANSFACGLLILARPIDHTEPSFHLVGDLLLNTHLPVLVV